MERKNIKKIFEQYSLNTYTRVGPVFVKGKGSWLWDEKGRRYLDLFPGWGVSVLGHCHLKIAEAIGRQAKKLIHLPNNLFFKEQAFLAKKITELSFPAKVFFANSGAESIEGAIKLSRLYGQKKRYEVVVMNNSFHGRTFAALSATGQNKYKVPFKPIVSGFKEARFNDFLDVKRKCNKKTVAVLLELIQGEGGVNVAQSQFISSLSKYCRKNDLLFIIDEVQTGIGRTGELFCFKHYKVVPDIMVLSKGLGAGFPVSAIVVGEKASGLISPGMHASTFGGSPLACVAVNETLKVIKQKKLLDNAKFQGKYLTGRLLELKNKFSFVKDVRGKGLMIGVELAIDSYPIFLKCLEAGLIVNSTHKNVLRIMPALNVTRKELDQGLKIIEKVLEDQK